MLRSYVGQTSCMLGYQNRALLSSLPLTALCCCEFYYQACRQSRYCLEAQERFMSIPSVQLPKINKTTGQCGFYSMARSAASINCTCFACKSAWEYACIPESSPLMKSTRFSCTLQASRQWSSSVGPLPSRWKDHALCCGCQRTRSLKRAMRACVWPHRLMSPHRSRPRREMKGTLRDRTTMTKKRPNGQRRLRLMKARPRDETPHYLDVLVF